MKMPEVLNILVTDDNELIREGLIIMLEKWKAVKTHVFSAKNGKEAVDIAAKEKDLDIILMDMSMPVMDGVEATRIITRSHRRCKVICVSMHSDDDSVNKMRQAGASAYLLKDNIIDNLEQVIAMALEGKSFFKA